MSDSPWSRMTKAEREAWIQDKAALLGAGLDDIDADHPRPGEPPLRSIIAMAAREQRQADGRTQQ